MHRHGRRPGRFDEQGSGAPNRDRQLNLRGCLPSADLPGFAAFPWPGHGPAAKTGELQLLSGGLEQLVFLQFDPLLSMMLERFGG